MEVRNNNKAVETELAKVYYKKNSRRNEILVLSIAMSLFLLYAAFSIASGKIRADYLIDIRGMGTLATISLENGSEEQLNQMKSLPYISEVGLKKTLIEGKYKDKWSGRLVYIDNNAYEKMFKPAYTDIRGSYPQKANEIMLSVESLQQMGIEDPKLGDSIGITFELDDEEETKEFILSGYYTDYIDPSINIPEAYVSRAFLTDNGFTLFPVDKIMAVQSSLDSGEDIERRLYFDIDMEYDSQQVFGENPMVLQSVEGFTGSISIAVGCGILVIACAFMLIYNVVSISAAKDIQEYGLLKVIGTTDQQLKRIVYRQNVWNILKGTLLGSFISVGVVYIFLRSALQKLFMQGYGNCDVNTVYPAYLVLSIFIISITTFFATSVALRQVIKWNAINSIKYVEADTKYRKTIIESTEDISLFRMAWRNVTKSKRRLLISSLSLILGGITALGSAVIMTGIDLRNNYQQNPDFRVGILTGIFRYPEKVPDEINDNTQIMSNEMLNNIYGIDGIDEDTIDSVTGSYALINFDEDEALQPRKNSIDSLAKTLTFATIQVVNENYVEKLEKYVDKYDLAVDIDSVKAGTGCVLLHYDEMSQILNDQAKEAIGMPIHFYSLDAYDKNTNLNMYKKAPIQCAGYMDCTAKYFPKLATTSMGNNINYFIMTEEAFQKLGFPEKVFDISFDTEDGQEELVNQKLSQIVQRENVRSGEMDTYYLEANYTLLEAEQNKIQTGNIILGSLTLIILLVGIMNFTNTIVADYATRKRELAIMESIGLTKNQLWKMIFLEGFCYWIITMTGVLFLGTIITYILGTLIKQKLLYFRFVYPWKQLLLMAAILLIIDFVFSIKIYCKNQKEPLIDRIKL